MLNMIPPPVTLTDLGTYFTLGVYQNKPGCLDNHNVSRENQKTGQVEQRCLTQDTLLRLREKLY